VGSFTSSFRRAYGKKPTAYRAAFPPAAEYAVIPACVLRVYGRPQHRTFGEDPAGAGVATVGGDRSDQTGETAMIKVANAQLWVHDQDDALEFYTKKVGMEVP
jgi:hypothetical protein